MITCFTDAEGATGIQHTNEALFTRIKNDIIELPAITSRSDIKILTEYLNVLFESNKTSNEIDKIVSQLNKFNNQSHNQRNRYLIRRAAELLTNKEETTPLFEGLKNNNLDSLFNTTKEKLELAGVFKSLHQKFFDPLEYYLEANHYLRDGSEIDRRDFQSFIDYENKKIHYFIFSENSDVENINRKVNTIIDKYQQDIIIYSPIKLELSNSSITIENISYKFEILDYEPEKLFILLNMFREHFELQDTIGEIISSYTNKFL